MSRYCPYCGCTLSRDPYVCPCCSRTIGEREWINEARRINEPVSAEEFRLQISERGRNRNIAIILSVIPAFFGLLGLAQIYLDRRDRSGYFLLAAGIVTLLISSACIYSMTDTGTFSAVVLTIPLLIFSATYILIAAVCIRHVLTGCMGFGI